MKAVKIFITICILLFAFIGLVFTSVFIAMQFGWLNVRGSIENRNNSIISIDTVGNSPISLLKEGENTTLITTSSCEDLERTCAWASTEEWAVVAGGLKKDLAVIERVSSETGVSPRLIASVVVPEQLRFFSANREVFKRYFEPLKILGSLSKFSLGVSGIKQETAEEIERHALNPESAFYPGEKYSALLRYESEVNKSNQLFQRLTDEKDHYYSYLYSAIFIKQIIAQWEHAGYDISDRADIVATIFNIGFNKSKPNPDPKVGGAHISIGGVNYTFGELSGLFYQSDALLEFVR